MRWLRYQLSFKKTFINVVICLFLAMPLLALDTGVVHGNTYAISTPTIYQKNPTTEASPTAVISSTPISVPTVSLTPSVHPTSTKVNLTPSFDWIGFLSNIAGAVVGGAIAGVVVLELQRYLEDNDTKQDREDKKKNVKNALNTEIKGNIQVCDDILDGYHANSGKIFPYHHHFSTSWLQIYKDKFIDFSKENERDMYEELDWFHKQITAIEDQRKNMQLFDAFTKVTLVNASQQMAMHNYQGINEYYTGIAVMTNELKEKLKKFSKRFEE